MSRQIIPAIMSQYDEWSRNNKVICMAEPEGKHDKHDKHGNNTDFSDDIMSDMTIKGLLGKWTTIILSRVNTALWKYYFRTDNIDAGDVEFVKNKFMETTRLIPDSGTGRPG